MGMKLANSSILDRAVLETLETRQMLSSVTFDSGHLTITGLGNKTNAIQLKQVNGRVMTVINGDRSSRQLEGIKSITITGGDKADYIEVEQKLTVPVTIHAKAGDDRVIGGGGNDVIEGGAGNDTIRGGRGADMIYGNAGNDRIYAGDGNDTINGNAGNDRMFGEKQNDLFQSVQRYDKVVGGAGRDSMTIDPANKPETAPEGNVGNVPTTSGTAVKVIGFSLVDASNGNVVKGYSGLNTGDVLDLSKLPAKLSIIANLDRPGSVRFDFDGTKMYRMENVAPYALGGDNGFTSYKAMNFTVGEHALTAHSVVKETGEIISTAGVTFKVVKTSSTSQGTDKPASTDGGSNPSTGTGNAGTGTDSDNGTTVPGVDNNTNANVPEAKIAAISTTVPAGTSIHVDAVTSLMGYGAAHEGQFLWDFGDAGTRYNKLKGFSAAHTYDQPGQYTVTLSVINKAGKLDKAQLTVNVTSAARKVIYVSSDGSDNNTGLTAGSAIKSFAKAASMVGNNTEILFQRGDTFTLSAGMKFRATNVLVGAFGIGDRPVIKWTGERTPTAIFQPLSGSANITFQDMTIDTRFNQDANDASTPLGFSPSGTNITVRRTELLNLMYGANLNTQPDGFMFQDNTAPLETGIRKYLVWVEGEHTTIIGNTCANSTREHVVRGNHLSKLLVMDNDFSNISRRDVDYWDYRKTALNIQSGEWAYLADNKLDGSLQIGPLGKSDGLKHPEQRFYHAILEGNTVINDRIEVNHGANQVTIRHNVIKANGYSAIQVDGYDSTFKRGTVDLVLHNNTGYNTGTAGRFIDVTGTVDGFSVLNNMYVAPNLTPGSGRSAGMTVATSNLNSIDSIDGNLWAIGNNSQSWVGENAVNHLGSSYGDNFQTIAEWNAQAKVGTDYHQNVNLSGATFTTIGGKIIGAKAA